MKVGNITIRDLGGNKQGFNNVKESVPKSNNFTETNRLSKDGKFVIPIHEYKLPFGLFFSHKYNSNFSGWRLKRKPYKKCYPYTKTKY